MSDSTEFSVSDEVTGLINDIITKNNWAPVLDVQYSPGSAAGDGFACKHIAVDIIKPEKETIKLFVKYAVPFKAPAELHMEKLYANETYFYDKVYPIYKRFLTDKNLENCFEHVPKFYGATSNDVIALENLKPKGYRLFDRKDDMSEAHIILVFRTLAKFHAISFAFKDQNKEQHDEFVRNWDGDHFGRMPKEAPSTRTFYNMIKETLDKFDPELDKEILERCDAEVLYGSIFDVVKNSGEYSIFTQGDCWCNNIMFLYENEDPIDVMLVDWQLFRPTSPVFDLSYFFYNICTEKTLNNLDSYLDIYYAELCDCIGNLGSDPQLLYPKTIFKEEWRKYCKFGFTFAFFLVKLMLAKQDEAPKVADIDYESLKETDKVELFPKYENEDGYLRRMRMLAQHMVDKDYV